MLGTQDGEDRREQTRRQQIVDLCLGGKSGGTGTFQRSVLGHCTLIGARWSRAVDLPGTDGTNVDSDTAQPLC